MLYQLLAIHVGIVIIIDALFPIPYSRLPTPDSRLPTPFATNISIDHMVKLN
ncbi:MAG: hypothetical protein F6K63_19005 [Moorea sp. SIO1G6]|uniref:hypothetical protein n=1 Tax=Moorena sp. SIO1G6 TaxID=2607840 RepID=UPI0013C1333B|nr:hypothetical protein [Moorena sp. SIO1G6]NET66363.1 hypothetical protein [Moorena sp. SIO1G6]